MRCFNERLAFLGSGVLLPVPSLCPTILRHNVKGLSHSGRGQLKQVEKATSKYITKGSFRASPEPLRRSKTTGAETGAIGAGLGTVALTMLAGKYWLGW